MLVAAPARPRFDRFRAALGLGEGALAPLTPSQARAADLASEGARIVALAPQAEAPGLVGPDNAAALEAGGGVTLSDPAGLVRRLKAEGLWPADARETVRALVAADFFERAYYAYPVMTAVAQAERMGLRALTIVEFGVWTGTGLLNMASIAEAIGEAYGIDIRVVGFDTGAGMPAPAGWMDHPELWHDGDLVMPDTEALRRRLPPHARLILGDVAETVPAFAETLTQEAPLGFVALDLDFHSSSAAALSILDREDQSVYLPAVPIYVDDSYIGITQHQLSGEALAIHMHNLPNIRALERGAFDEVRTLILPKRVRPRHEGRAWHHCIHFAHMHRHPLRREKGDVKLNGLHHVRY